MRLTGSEITRAVGLELRLARTSVGWTRPELVARLPSEIHVQTYASYEQGVRQCTVARLVEICQTLGEPASDVLGLAVLRAKAARRQREAQPDPDR